MLFLRLHRRLSILLRGAVPHLIWQSTCVPPGTKFLPRPHRRVFYDRCMTAKVRLPIHQSWVYVPCGIKAGQRIRGAAGFFASGRDHRWCRCGKGRRLRSSYNKNFVLKTSPVIARSGWFDVAGRYDET